MSHTPNFDAKVKAILDTTKPGERVCPISGERWECTQEELDWCRHFNVPPSPVEPMARLRWLRGFNIGVEIWRNKDSETGESILTYVHPDNPIPVTEDVGWHAVDWSARAALKPDSQKSLFEQIRELVYKIPVQALRSFHPPVNTIGASLISAVDSFMVFAGIVDTKRSAYGYLLDGVEDCQDVFFTYKSTSSFGLNHCERMHECRVALHSQDCIASSFLFDCRNCEYVFGGWNLRNRKFVLWNEQLSEGEWRARTQEIDLRSRRVFGENARRYLSVLETDVVWPENVNVQSEECTGEYLMRCVRVHGSFGIHEGSDMFRCIISHKKSERAAYTSGFSATSDVYMTAGTNSCANILYCSNVGFSQNLEYCLNCRNCEYCFGCNGLENKKFHIFNMSYVEDAYWQKLDEIKCAALERGEYGRFLPGDFSPAGVEFATSIFFDYPEREFEAIGAVRFDPRVGAVQDASNMIDPETLPDHLDECEEYIGKAMIDKDLGRAFAVRRDDYKFYQKLGLPFPRRHYIARVRNLARMANTFTSSETQCAKCSKSITIADNLTFKQRKVYCYGCYLEYLEKCG